MFLSRLLSPAVVAVLFLVGCASPAAMARDQAEYGRYLGVRLRMYEEAYEILDKAIAKAEGAEKNTAKQAKADVLKSQADYNYSQDGDEANRQKLYRDAIDIFGDATTPESVLAKSRMQLEAAKMLQRVAPAVAREYCDAAIKACDAVRITMEAGRNNPAVWNKIYLTFSKVGFTLVNGYYVKALTFAVSDPERSVWLRQCEDKLAEFQFSLDDATAEQVLSFELQGDIELARGQPEAAVGKFRDLVDFVKTWDPEAVGALALEHGYLRAAAILTSELDYDPRFLNQVVELYNAAFARYGAVRKLDYYFKSFQLYRVSAMIKLGDPEKVAGAIDSLFRLATDTDASFRRQAMSVLADVASRDKLDNDLRFRCATTVYKDLASLPYTVMLSVAQAHQALLASCSDVQTFETYGPACFERAGFIYAGMWRFLDAAMVYREGAARTAYFQTKFNDKDPVPAHMLGRSERIKDGPTLVAFPGDMAGEYVKNAKILVSAKYGEPGNAKYAEILSHAEKIKAALGGWKAEQDRKFNEAGKRVESKQYVQAAVKYANVDPRYREKYFLAINNSAAAYYRATYEGGTFLRVNAAGEPDERESEDWFKQQKDHFGDGLEALPDSMKKGHEAHWEAVLNRSMPGPVANWHKGLAQFKKYFLIEIARAWPDVGPTLKDNPKPDYIDGLLALTRLRNAAWQRLPADRREPDGDLRRMAAALYYFAYMLRNPPKGEGGDAEVDKLRKENQPDATRVLTPYWEQFGPHMDGLEELKSVTLKMVFGAQRDAGDVERAEATYRTYCEAFAKDTAGILDLIRPLFSLVQERVLPRAQAMIRLSQDLESYSNQLKKGVFNAIDPVREADAFKKYTDAKTELGRHRALADYFWNKWMLARTFQGERKDDIARELPDVLPRITQRWQDLAGLVPGRWADAVKAELDAQLQLAQFKAIAPLVTTETAGVSKYDLFDRVKALREKPGQNDAAVQSLVSLFAAIEANTEHLRYFTGTVFIYEFGDFLVGVANDITQRARPITTYFLKYYEEKNVKTGDATAGVRQDVLKQLCDLYFSIGDWEHAIHYLQEYLTRFGGEKEYGKEESIEVDARSKAVGRAKSGEELEIKYQLGRSYLERYKVKNDVEDLKRAALLMRRCWCFNLVRDANEIAKSGFALRFQKELEAYYLYIGQSMAEIFTLLHTAPVEIRIDWPKYVNQFTKTLEVDAKSPVQEVPSDKASALWFSREIWQRIWTSFRILDSYQYRGEFRQALEAWIDTSVRWVKTYGAKDMGIAELKGPGLSKVFGESLTSARNEAMLGSAYFTEDTKAYIARVKALGDKLEAACKEAGIKTTK